MDSSIKKSLYEAARRLNSVKFDYALIGSANLALQGIDIKPNDIDFFVKPEQYPKLEEAFFEYEFSPLPAIQNQGKIYLKKKIFLDGVEVEFGTEPAEGWYSKHLKNWTVTSVEAGDDSIDFTDWVSQRL
jgi:predicted nucleotidyltransferase